MRSGWLALALAGCAARSTSTVPSATEPERVSAAVPAGAAVFVDPPPPPCPASGWLTAEVLIGPWSIRYGSARGTHTLMQHAKRDDYLADGTVHGVRLVRPVSYRDRWQVSGGSMLALPDQEQRSELTGSWHVDETGLLELRWIGPQRTEMTRGRVWVDIEAGPQPHARLHRHPLTRGADEVWRSEVFTEVTEAGVTRGFTSRIELRFEPPLQSSPSSCGVEIRRELAVWGGGPPATWKDRARGLCTVEGRQVRIEPDERRPGRWPEHDARLQGAYAPLEFGSYAWIAADILVGGHDWEPHSRGRPVEPPILWHDAAGRGWCTPGRP
ncbi:hypothetical protein [Nannocystis bainbridge]|uniref:Uncharacterized protein n=1 Tax=Nannocystis bainbridge TaxID=2995303 RepID=A0ABT5E4C6_9BACT|nr:hypothetical protein [Nannocystis bainbridge]MDC0720696.1 hypothetical protein [Nannocystis bainbridge]